MLVFWEGGEARKNLGHSFAADPRVEIKRVFKRRRAVCIQRDASGKRKEVRAVGEGIKERKKRESLELWILYARGASQGVVATQGWRERLAVREVTITFCGCQRRDLSSDARSRRQGEGKRDEALMGVGEGGGVD